MVLCAIRNGSESKGDSARYEIGCINIVVFLLNVMIDNMQREVKDKASGSGSGGEVIKQPRLSPSFISSPWTQIKQDTVSISQRDI